MVVKPLRTLIACSLGHRDLAKQFARWQSLRARAEMSFGPTDRGVQLVLRNDPGVERELESLVEVERTCCAFADWSTHIENGRVVLDVTGESPEAIAVVQGMLRAK